MTDSLHAGPIQRLSVTRLPQPEGDALVAAGGWCAPIGVTYDLFLRPCTTDRIAWDRPDWNRLVAPRLSALIAARAEGRRRVRLARYALSDLRDAVLGREPTDACDCCV
jgi:hypothetical protein